MAEALSRNSGIFGGFSSSREVAILYTDQAEICTRFVRANLILSPALPPFRCFLLLFHFVSFPCPTSSLFSFPSSFPFPFPLIPFPLFPFPSPPLFFLPFMPFSPFQPSFSLPCFPLLSLCIPLLFFSSFPPLPLPSRLLPFFFPSAVPSVPG